MVSAAADRTEYRATCEDGTAIQRAQEPAEIQEGTCRRRYHHRQPLLPFRLPLRVVGLRDEAHREDTDVRTELLH